MEYFYIYPAKVYAVEKPTRPNMPDLNGPFEFEAHGYKWQYCLGGYSYFDTAKGRAVWKNCESDHGDYWLIDGEKAIKFTQSHNHENFLLRLTLAQEAGSLEPLIESMRAAVLNPAQYEESQRIERERVKLIAQAEDKARELKRAKEKEEAEKLYRELLTAAKDDFLQGRLIGWEYFEALCREYGIAIHMRTMGMARKKCSEIGLTSARIAGGNAGQLFAYTRALDSAIRA